METHPNSTFLIEDGAICPFTGVVPDGYQEEFILPAETYYLWQSTEQRYKWECRYTFYAGPGDRKVVHLLPPRTKA